MAKSSRRKKPTPKPLREVQIPTEIQEPVITNQHEALSGWPVILGWAAMLLFTFHACTHMVAAGDTWVAMACGRHFVNHGVDTVEPFSANSHKAGPTQETMAAYARQLNRDADEMARDGQDHGMKYSLMRWWADKCDNFENWPQWKQSFTKWIHPTGWINQNWLTHVIFYELVPKSSYADGVSFTSNALVYWKFAIYIITVICVYFTSRQLGVNPVLAAVFCCFALFIGRSFLDIRPAGFSNMLVAVYLLILALSMYRNYLFIWLLVPLTVFWCNVHGGYIYVFIMMVPFLGLNFLTCLNKKWTAIFYNIVAWPFLFFVLSKAGMTIATLLFFILLIILDFVLIFGKAGLVHLNWKGFFHAIGASAAAFICAIIFNPFHLTNFTHTFVISISKNAARWRDIHEWKPAFEWTNPVGTAVPFLIMYILIWIAFVIWAVTLIISYFSNDQYARRKKSRTEQYQWPKINIPMILISALTIYMAIRSRRFIPIAGIVACPIIAFFIQELIRYYVSTVSIRKYGTVIAYINDYIGEIIIIAIAAGLLIVGLWQLLLRKWLFIPIPGSDKSEPRIILFILGVILAYAVLFVSMAFWPIIRDRQKTQARDLKLEFIFSNLALGARLILLTFLIGFGIWFSMKFNQVYLEPWPNDTKFTSVFMRMTASDAKPFYAMKYIKDNKLHGNMFNYWTEGGFIAWGQEPDPNTGRTPLQLFMDGRAQAAYDRITFDEWSYILAGGQPMREILNRLSAAGQSLSNITEDDLKKIGNHVDKLLRESNVWIMMMPSNVYNNPDRENSYYTFKAIEQQPSWKLVFYNDRQKILVDIRTEQGKKLYDGILDDTTIYPDEYHKNLMKGYRLLVWEPTFEDKKEGLDCMIKAFKERQSPVAMLDIIVIAGGYSALTPYIQEFCKEYSDSFFENQKKWIREDGYRMRAEAARLANFRMAEIAHLNNAEMEETYASRRDYCLSEVKRINDDKKW